MFGLRLTTEVQKRWKNGKPHQTTTGVASANSIQGRAKRVRNILPIEKITSGVVRIAATQNRRVISRTSGFSSSAAVTVRGSSAMPQIGQDPGSRRTISGCIGQVYSVRVAGSGFSGSNAIPQEGHGTGFVSRTSGHIGQT